MERAEIFAAATRMRLDTADWLETLDDTALDTASLCAGWRVRDVAGHVLAPLVTSVPAMLWHTFRSGLNLHKGNTSLAREIAAQPVADLAETLRRHAGTELVVPIVGAHGPFTDLVVHNADMRVPLDAPWPVEPAWAAECLSFVANGAVGFADKKRLAGLRIEATDAPVRSGHGATLRGPSYALLLALCGRVVGLEPLDGPGVSVLAERIAD